MSKEKRFVIQVDPLEIEDDAIFDNKELRLYECQSDMMSDICSLLNQQDQRIAELEEQLKNAPKYTVYSKVFFVDDCEKTIKEDFVEQITINHRDGILYELINNFLFEESELFATKEEAQAKLRELQGEKK